MYCSSKYQTHGSRYDSLAQTFKPMPHFKIVSSLPDLTPQIQAHLVHKLLQYLKWAAYFKILSPAKLLGSIQEVWHKVEQFRFLCNCSTLCRALWILPNADPSIFVLPRLRSRMKIPIDWTFPTLCRPSVLHPALISHHALGDPVYEYLDGVN